MIGSNHPLISVLVPVWNVEKYIERCARSIFEQTYDNLDIIFVNDQTLDNSIQILERIITEYPNREKQVRIIHHKTNRGLSAARNTAVDACKGDFIFHVDSDDWVEIKAIELLMKKQIETNADIVTGKAYAHTVFDVYECLDGGTYLEKDKALLALIEGTISHSVWRRIIRSSLYRKHGIKNIEGVNVDEDFQVMIPLFYYSKKVTGIPEFVYNYNRINENSYINNLLLDENLQNQYLQSFLFIYDFFKNKELIYQEEIEKRKLKSYKSLMHYAIIKGNIKRYYFYLDKVSNNEKYWPSIGWNSKMRRRIESNYYLYRIIFPIQTFCTFLNNRSFSYILGRILFKIKIKLKKMRDK